MIHCGKPAGDRRGAPVRPGRHPVRARHHHLPGLRPAAGALTKPGLRLVSRPRSRNSSHGPSQARATALWLVHPPDGTPEMPAVARRPRLALAFAAAFLVCTALCALRRRAGPRPHPRAPRQRGQGRRLARAGAEDPARRAPHPAAARHRGEASPCASAASTQWISVRGRDRRNPILLFIHGGPASTEMPVSWLYQSGWEDYFTVVQWDQRGAGKTYVANDPAVVEPTITAGAHGRRRRGAGRLAARALRQAQDLRAGPFVGLAASGSRWRAGIPTGCTPTSAWAR